MGILCMDERVWRALTERLKTLDMESRQLRKRFDSGSPDPWLDGQEVCQALRITKRTLQSYRDKGLLGCSTVGGKYYYREKDVTEFLQARTAKKEI